MRTSRRSRQAGAARVRSDAQVWRLIEEVAGGSGLYLRAALAELELPPAPPAGARGRWEERYAELGPEATHALLAREDPAAAELVHPNDRRRVVRALELAEAGSSLRPVDDRLWAGETRHPSVVFGLEVPKDVLERRIEERTRSMFDRGVVEEVRTALAVPDDVAAVVHVPVRAVGAAEAVLVHPVQVPAADHLVEEGLDHRTVVGIDHDAPAKDGLVFGHQPAAGAPQIQGADMRQHRELRAQHLVRAQCRHLAFEVVGGVDPVRPQARHDVFLDMLEVQQLLVEMPRQ